MMNLPEQTITCPYCNEQIDILLDIAEGDTSQDYIEDCQVCCRPIQIHVYEDETGQLVVQAQHENDV